MSEQDTIGVQEMAERLGVTTQTIYNYIERGLIRGVRVRKGLSYRLVVQRADFEAAAARLFGDMDNGDILKSEDKQTPRAEAVTA